MENSYLYLKALHIIFVVCWFAGLFYVVRLFVYYAEAQQKTDIAQQILLPQFTQMALRLWNIITFPSAILATCFGFSLLLKNTFLWTQPWMQLKLCFIVLLWGYHGVCHHFVKQMKQGKLTKKASFFRIWNEGATLLLFSVVFLVILKNTINWIYGTLGIVLLAVLLMLGYKYYKKIRERSPEK